MHQPLLRSFGTTFPLDWNGPVSRAFAPFRPCDVQRPIAALFEAMARRHAGRIALDDGTTRLTYSETFAWVLSLAATIASQTEADELVGLLLPTSVEFMVGILACFAAGRLFAPLDLHYPKAWLANVIADAGMAAVVGHKDEAADLAPPGVRWIDVKDRVASDAALAPLGASDPAFVLYTSGSTGKPKGIVNSQQNLLARVEQYINAAHVSPDDRFMPLSSECTIAGLRERLTALLSGASLHLIDVQRSGARQILNRLRGEDITMIYGVPALLRSLMQLDSGGAPASLRNVRVGGDSVLWSDVALLRRWLPEDCRIQLGYSSTEAPIMQWFVPRDFPQDGARVPIGYPLSANRLSIVDDGGEPVAAGEVGELVVRSPYVALGRWSNGRFLRDGFPEDEKNPAARVLHTGDLVALRPDGLVDLVGRKDRQIKIRGIRVEPAETEAALRGLPDVLDAAVLPRRLGDGVQLVAYVSLKADAAADGIGALRQALKDSLAPALQPHRIYPLTEIPRLPSAKFDLAALQALDREHQTRESAEAVLNSPAEESTTADPLEATIAGIWRRLLSRPEIGRDADFFDLGGDSLMTLNLMFELEEALGVELPVTMIYEAPTVAALAEAIRAQVQPRFSPLVKIKSGTVGPAFFMVHGVGGNVMELIPLGRQLDFAGDIYAIQAKGLDGREEPNRSIAAMAGYYLDAIRAVQPHGPYRLGGYSSGGLIAFEMARMLERAGETVASLILLDTQTNARQWPARVWLAFAADRGRAHVAALRALPPLERLRYAARVSASGFRRLRWRAGFSVTTPQPAPLVSIPPALRRVYDATIDAIARYRPGRFGGRLTLIVSEARDPRMSPDPARLWRSRAGALDLLSVPGTHRSMLTGANGRVLAQTISDCLCHGRACRLR
jgi:acyl-coenzyme A synthetase/AMP-(fatty) acid ligase/thioesterase domain-containing protein/acyl carrier protein